MSDLEKYRNIINHEGDGPSDELSEFLKKSSVIKVPAKKSKEELWNAISSAIDKDQEAAKGSFNWRYIGIAASITLIAVVSFLLFRSPAQVEFVTNSGEKINQVLPDGSRVILNASSMISYSDDWNRELHLVGEAFFEVTKGEKFLVKTAIGNVQVLGTSFNVFARDGDFKVACKTGKVRVSIPSRSFSEEIKPGQTITVDADTVKIVFRIPEAIGAWQTGEFKFDNVSISKVFEEFERQFSVEIEFKPSDDQVFSGYFRNDIGVDKALEMVCVVMSLEYQRTGDNRFTISKSTEY